MAGEDGLFLTIQYLQHTTEGLSHGEPAAVALLDGLLPAFVEAVAREAAAAVPEVRQVHVSCTAVVHLGWRHMAASAFGPIQQEQQQQETAHLSSAAAAVREVPEGARLFCISPYHSCGRMQQLQHAV